MSSSRSVSPFCDGAVGPAAKRARREAAAGAPLAVADEQPPARALALQSLPAQMQQMQGQLQAQMQQMQAQMQALVEAARLSTQAQMDASRTATQAQFDAMAARVTAQVTARVAALVAPSSGQPPRDALIALRVRYAELVTLDQRVMLSPAEEVLSIPFLSQRSVMSFLRQEDVLGLRAASRACRDAVAEHAWGDFDGRSRITGSLASWRRCFPHAIAANLNGNNTVRDADLAHLRGVNKVDIRVCMFLTDAGLAHLSGIHTLHIAYCERLTDAGLAHLGGIHEVNMNDCTAITDAGLAHLRGIHTLGMERCTAVTDAGLTYLRGIHTLYMDDCTAFTDAGLAHLRGIQTLDMSGCTAVTDAGLAHLRGIHTLLMNNCPGITNAGLVHLRGIRKLHGLGSQLTAAALAQLAGAEILVARLSSRE